MARVRCTEKCYANHRVYETGAEFDYDGPEQSYLQLLKGEWTKPLGRRSVAEIEAENAELRELRRKLAQLEPGAQTAPGDSGDSSSGGQKAKKPGKRPATSFPATP